MNVFSILKSLTPQELSFLQTEKIVAEETASEWVSFFKKALEFDKKADSTRKKYMALAILSIPIIPLASFVVFIFLVAIIPEIPKYKGEIAMLVFFISILSGIPFLLFTIFAFYKYFKLRKYNIKCNKDIISKVIPIITLLREETKINQKIKLAIDLTKAEHSSKFVGKSPAYAKGVYHKVIDSDYKNDWIKGETLLADGTFLMWSISDLIRQQKKTKRNFRGKYKTKYKYKNKTYISLDAGLERKQFILPPKLKQKGVEGAIRTKKQGKHDWIQIKRVFKHDVNPFHIKYFIDTIASVYMRAKPNLNRS